MAYQRTISCPICGEGNVVPDDLSKLVQVRIERGIKTVDFEEFGKLVKESLEACTQYIQKQVVRRFKRRGDDLNGWINVRCSKPDPETKVHHYFQYHTRTSDVRLK